MMPLVIIGTGGSAYDVLDIVESINAQEPTWEVKGFLDDFRVAGTTFLHWPVLGRLADATKIADAQFINVIGSDKSFGRRPDFVAATRLPRERFATLVHSGAAVSARARLGRGVYVNHGACVAGAVKIADQVAVGPGCIVGHDAQVSEFSILAPAAVLSGYTKVGRGCYVGAAAVVKQQVELGDGCLVGMGAVVTKHVPAGAVVVGNPSRARK